MSTRIMLLLLLGCATGACATGAVPDAAAGQQPVTWEQILAAEDTRAPDAAALATLEAGLRAPQPELRAMAVRALGRLERPTVAPVIEPVLRDPVPAVRAAAAHALGQAVVRTTSPDVRAQVAAALRDEADANVRAALAETLGRLRQPDAAVATATATQLTGELAVGGVRALGAVRGLFFLARQQPARAAVAAAADALRRTVAVVTGSSDEALRTRRLAVATLVAAGAHDAAVIERALGDTDALVRREAAAGLNTLADTAAAWRLLQTRALTDRSEVVRYEAVRAHMRRFAARTCAPALAAVRGDDDHVALLGLDLLRNACPGDASITALLDSVAAALPAAEHAWHEAAHALVSLAARDPARARMRLPRIAQHPSLFARTYAAEAAGIIGDTATLLRLARDAHPNVRTAAVQALRRVAGRAADSVFIAQLALDDSQLLQAAAAALDSTTRADAVPRLLDALERISTARRETSRDARVALLQRIAALGDRTSAPRVQQYVRDFDPAVATLAAEILTRWTGTTVAPAPTAPPRLQLPTRREADQLAGTRFVFEMADGSSFEVRLLPFDAPTNAARFARLARAGWFDGLTFHRVVPNFIVQGGSPGANEYAGDGPYTRDELGVPNWRGTIGLSTRGRDTGDAQIFINTVDNVRLDHDYTVFALVVAGMDAVDRMLEGARIVRIRF